MPPSGAAEQTSVPSVAERTTPPGSESFVNTEDKAWFENLLEEAKNRPLTPEENQKISEKLKGYDRSISKHRGELDRQKADLQSQKQEVAKVIEELKQAKSPRDVSDAMRGTTGSIRDLLEEAIDRTDDPSSRETLRWLDKVLQQRLSKLDKFEKDMTEFRQSLQGIHQTSQTARFQSLQQEVNELEVRYGDAVVEKYRDSIIQYGTQYPNYSARRLLHMVADPDEVEQAVELQGRKKEMKPEPKNQKHPSPVSTASAHPSDNFRGKTPREKQKGFEAAFYEAFENIKGKMPGL